jgi:hypothetical protein
MADVDGWEEQFIRKYASKAKQARYLSMLKGPKHRRKFLECLNHTFEYDPRWAIALPDADQSESGLLQLLRARYVADTCHIMADGNDSDGRSLRLELGIQELHRNWWGTVVICPPVPIAIYKPEVPGQPVLLERRAT